VIQAFFLLNLEEFIKKECVIRFLGPPDLGHMSFLRDGFFSVTSIEHFATARYYALEESVGL
jgi:hypothetical protein